MKPTKAHLRQLAEADPALGRVMFKVPPYPGFPTASGGRGSHFQALARSIVYQQLAGNAAYAIHRRCCALTSGTRFPSPEECRDIDDDTFRAAGLSAAKTRAVRDLADKTLDGTVTWRSVSRMSDDDVIAMLTQVRGVGVWTAQMFLLFRLGRMDVMPTGDLGVREGARILDQLRDRPSPAEVLERSEPWKPFRSVATWVLYRLVETPEVVGG